MIKLFKRKWLLNLGVIIASILLAVGIVEISLWLIAPIRAHEWMEWIPDGHIKARGKPRQTFLAETISIDGTTVECHEIKINSLGFRGPEYNLNPAPRTLRLVVHAGSAGFCYSQKDDETWPERLRYYLSKKINIPIEIINLSMPGFDTFNSKVNYLFNARELHPHVALLYHSWNDMKLFRLLEQPERLAQAIMFAGIGNSNYIPYWKRLGRMTQIGRRVRNLLLARDRRYIENRYSSMENETANRPVSNLALEWDKRNFSDFVLFSQADKVLPVLISQGTLVSNENINNKRISESVDNDMVGMTFPILIDTWLRMNSIIKEVAEKQSAIFVDGYNEVPHTFQYLEDHVHLTKEGCDILANTIADTLLKDERFQKIIQHISMEEDIKPTTSKNQSD